MNIEVFGINIKHMYIHAYSICASTHLLTNSPAHANLSAKPADFVLFYGTFSPRHMS